MNQVHWILFLYQVALARSWTLSNLLMSGTKATLSYSDTVALGAQKGLDECREQFLWHRWNCPQTVFTQIFSKNNPLPANRETAFVHAIISAGIVHTVTKNCSMGQFDRCRCDSKRSRAKLETPLTHQMNASNEEGPDGDQSSQDVPSLTAFRDNYRWGGCSDNVEFGFDLAKSFLDEREIGHDSKAIINLHNNLVGRMAVKNTMQKICKCHGVSGSCTTQTCWMRIGEFKAVGNYLKEAYKRALKVTGSTVTGNSNGRVKKAIVDKDGHSDTDSNNVFKKEEQFLPLDRLVYSEESPDYCVANLTLASLGTLGRSCSRRKGKDVVPEERRSCRTLCKKCGYKVKKSRKRVIKTCNCKFKWCCQVECESCAKEEVSFTCAP